MAKRVAVKVVAYTFGAVLIFIGASIGAFSSPTRTFTEMDILGLAVVFVGVCAIGLGRSR